MSPLKRLSMPCAGLSALLGAMLFVPSVAAQEYPTRTIRIISPVPAGGLSDIAMIRKDPDLAQLRKQRPEKLEALLKVKADYQLIYGVFKDDVTMRTSGYRYQRTIAQSAEVRGVGYLTGAAVRLRFHPAQARLHCSNSCAHHAVLHFCRPLPAGA